MNGTIEPIPLKESEAREIQLLWGVMEILSETSPKLKKRLQAVGRWRQYRVAATWMERITVDVMRTIEPSKRRKFLMNLENQEMRIVCKGVPDTAPGYTVVEQDVLHTYIRQAIGQCCVLCDGAGCDMVRCELRKALKKTVMFEIDETDGICFGKKLLTHMEG